MSDYPAQHTDMPFERIKKGRALLMNKEAVEAASKIFESGAAAPLRERVIAACGTINDLDRGSDSPEWMELRRCGEELYDMGGYILMQIVANWRAEEMAEERTEKGSPYRVRPCCNAAWNGIGEWVA